MNAFFYFYLLVLRVMHSPFAATNHDVVVSAASVC
jgi:hypothetical protein